MLNFEIRNVRNGNLPLQPNILKYGAHATIKLHIFISILTGGEYERKREKKNL